VLPAHDRAGGGTAQPRQKRFGDVPLSAITATAIAELQRTRHEAGIANRTINIDVGVLSRVLKSCGRWRALTDHVKNLPERASAPSVAH